MASSAAVEAMLLVVGHTGSLDAEIMEYICSVLDDPDEGSFELLLSVLGEYVSSFAVLTSDRQAELVLQLLDDVGTHVLYSIYGQSVFQWIISARTSQACPFRRRPSLRSPTPHHAAVLMTMMGCRQS
jgi:hypothetical protein